MFFGLEKPGTAHQTDLFDDTPPAEKSRLYAAVDTLNARYGKGKVFLRSALACARLGSLESRAPLARRLRAGPRRKVVAHEAAENPEEPTIGRALCS